MANRQATHVFVRVPGEPENEWLHIITAESLVQAYQVEDKWTFDGYHVKLVNKMTGRLIR